MYSYQLVYDLDGRIVEKIETVKGKSVKWLYFYDKKGRLFEAYLNNSLICQCYYDNKGRRSQDYFPKKYGGQMRSYLYRNDNRLQQAGNNGYVHDKQGFRSLWNCGGQYTRYKYAPDYRLLKAIKETEGAVFEFSHNRGGQREMKRCNGVLVEAYKWLDFIRLGEFYDGNSNCHFKYDGESRTPYVMQWEDEDLTYLYYDQVGSLRVVADASGNVIKEILYDPFGGIITDSNPDLSIPIGFAGGLHDRDLGFVRFGWRDFDTFTGRWTAPDPLGDAGGDTDWYGYCLDDPVNMHDPMGLMGGKTEDPYPDQTEPYFDNTWEWQASHGACEKCQGLDGQLFISEDNVEEISHPNCSCQLVECQYYSKYGMWKEVGRQVVDERIVTYGGTVRVVVIWERTIEITESRERFYMRECGSRMPALVGMGEPQLRKHEENEREKSAGFIAQDVLQTTNPWTGKGVQMPLYPGP